MLEEIKKIGFIVSLDTFGSSIIKDAIIDRRTVVKQVDAKKLAELVDEVGIPIDGSTNEVFKRFRQAKTDIVNEQIAICEELRRFGANICINTVAHKGNLEDVYELAKLIKGLDYIKKWQVFQYSPLGKFGLSNRKYFEITDKQFLEFKSAVSEVFNGDLSKIQFKNSKIRENAYMIVDNSGNAWIPSYDNMSLSKSSYIVNNDTIIGNIFNKEDWEEICSYLDRDFTQKDAMKSDTKNGYTLSNKSREEFIKNISKDGEYRKLSLPVKRLEQQESESHKKTDEKCK